MQKKKMDSCLQLNDPITGNCPNIVIENVSHKHKNIQHHIIS